MNQGQVNILYVTVVVCAPGNPANCQTIDHVQVDTQSYGLRLISQALQPSLAAALPAVNETQSGMPLSECTLFADGYSWGPVKSADVQIAGEKASAIEVQVIGDPTYSSVPQDCSNAGVTQEDTVAKFGANGIIGVGPFVRDCGSGCAPGGNEIAYYVCSSPESCTDQAPGYKGVMLSQQVSNPVASFATDNNGVIIELPALTSSSGQATVQGQMIFGIDTEANNHSTGASHILAGDPSTGAITTVYNAQSLNQSVIDSGSNGYFFTDNSLQQCPTSINPGFYCPTSDLTLSGTLEGTSGSPQVPHTFYVGNADNLDAANSAFDDLAGCPVGSSGPGSCASNSLDFDWGLPFFYGLNVYTAIACNVEAATCAMTSAGYGPYYAF